MRQFLPEAKDFGVSLPPNSMNIPHHYNVPDKKDEKYIPPGPYCYHLLKNGTSQTLNCPYWDYSEEAPDQRCGYCHFLELGDWQEGGTFLLWDMCKECGVKTDEPCNWNKEEDEYLLIPTIKWAESAISLLDENEHKQSAEEWLKKLKQKASEIEKEKK